MTAQSALQVTMPNGDKIRSTHSALLKWEHFPINARKCHIFPGLKNRILLSIGQFCDAGMTATFTATKLLIYKNNEILLEGDRNHTTGMWYVDLKNQTPCTINEHHRQQIYGNIEEPQANNVYELNKSKDIVTYLSKAMWNPVPSTWIKAINSGFFATWPGLTASKVKKYLEDQPETTKGHQRATRSNIRSTSKIKTKDSPETTKKRTNAFFCKRVEINNKLFSDQTGRFPVTSSKGSKYIMVVYSQDANAILAEPLKSKSALEHYTAMEKIFNFLNQRGIHPQFHIMDNECSDLVKSLLVKKNIQLQLTPPHQHRTNAAEKGIGIFKDHFISGLATVHPDFPLHLWCRLIPLAVTTLNLLRPSNLNPRLSAYELLNGIFDYNKTPLAPPGAKVIVHNPANKRRTWDFHGDEGWYLGMAPDHYRCHKVYITKTRSERIAQGVKFLPHNYKIPRNTAADVAIESALELVKALNNPAPNAPFAADKNKTGEALKKLADIFLVRAHTENENERVSPRVDIPVTSKPTAVPPRVVETVKKPNLQRTPSLKTPSSPTPMLVEESPREKRCRQRIENRNTIFKSIITAAKQIGSNLPPPHIIEPDQEVSCLTQNIGQCNHLQHKIRMGISEMGRQYETNAVTDEATGQMLEYRHLIKGPDSQIWKKSLANDFGRLAQGVGTRMKSGTNTIFFVHPSKIPQHKKVTYARLVADLRPLKSEVHRVRVTIGGDKLTYEGPTSTSSASLVLVKTHLNSVVSTTNAMYATLDIKDYFYGTSMTSYEYVRIALSLIPQEIIDQYDLMRKQVDGWVYMEVRKGMPGLKQAGRIAHDRLIKHLAQYGYAPCRNTPALWKHVTKPISFTLVVDDFGVKYIKKLHLQHLIDALRHQYTITVDMKGENYLGLTLKWNYDQRWVDISMPNYILQALHEFQHDIPSKPTHSPSKFIAPIYGAKIQYAEDPPDEPRLPPDQIKRIQKVVGKLLYYGLAVDNTLLVILGDLASDQTKSTKLTLDAVTHLLNYVATHPNAVVRFYKSGMILNIHSDGSYLSLPKARSRAGGYYYLSFKTLDQSKCPHNGPIYVLSRILKNVLASAAEVEIGATYANAQEAIPIRNTLIDMGHPQPPTPIQVDNTTAVGFANKSIKQKRSKAIDMRYYWIQDRTEQKQFHIYWSPGVTNKGDYHTKHFPTSHHRKVRSLYLHQDK